MLNPVPTPFGASGAGHRAGLVPDPGSSAGAARVLREDGWAAGYPGFNLLINGGFNYFQRQNATALTAVANNTYGPDRWYNLTDGGATDVQYQRTAGDTTSVNACRVKQTNAAAKKVGVAQIVEQANALPYRNRPVRFQVRVKSSATPTVRLALLEWTGTADALGAARDLVNAWANSADANPATTFFKSTTINVLGYTAGAAAGGGYADFSVTGTVGASANNLIVVAWTAAGLAQNVTVDFTQAGLYDGTSSRDWLPLPAQEELARCQRYYEKSYDPDVAPGTASTIVGCTSCYSPNSIVNGQPFAPATFAVWKRVGAAVTVYSYLGTVGKYSAFDTGNDVQLGTVTTNGARGFGLYSNGVGAGSGAGIFYHYTADAEL